MCVTLVDREAGDQVVEPKAKLLEYEERPIALVLAFLKRRLALRPALSP